MNYEYKIKENPEDFIVDENSKLELEENGKYIYFKLKKTNYTVIRALEFISRSLNLKLKNFGYAGTKDKKAITTQFVSVFGTNKKRLESISLDDIEIEFVGYAKQPLSLGDLIGNNFSITIRDYKKTPDTTKTEFINYFGEQRFSKNNSDVGLAILRKEYKKAIELILKNDGNQEHKIRFYLDKSPNDYVGALKLIPKKILRLLVASYQSLIWNQTAKFCLDNSIKIDKIPIVGFATEFDNEMIKNFVLNKLKIDNLKIRDFIVRSIPELSSEGTERQFIINTKIEVIEKTPEFIKIKFFLQKGAYATEIIRQIFTES